MSAVIIDMDGTLCDCSHRVHLAAAGQWDEFHSLLGDDPVMPDVKALLEMVPTWSEVIICTGRNEAFRAETLKWLEKHLLSGYIDNLIMRPDGDFRPDHELKPALIEEHFGSKEIVLENILFVIDDRDKVVEAWRNYGLPCWQCRNGNY